MNFKFFIYFIFIMMMSLVVANFFDVLTFSHVIYIRILISSFLLFAMHLVYFRFYNLNLNLENKFQVTDGLLYSSIVGGVLSLALFYRIYFYTESVKYIKFIGMGDNVLFMTIGLIVVGLISSIFCYFIDVYFSMKTKNISKIRIFLGASGFHILNIVGSFVVYLVALTLTMFSG